MNTSRRIEIGRNTCFEGFNAGKGFVRSGVFDATTLEPNSGINERQTVTVTGTPTGGTFTLSFKGNLSGNIAYNADAAAIEAALEGIVGIGDGDVRVLGGPLPGTAVTVDFINDLGHQDVPALVKNSAGLTGGTSPNVTVVETTKGADTGYNPRITIGTYDLPGTLVMLTGKSPNSLKEWDGVSGPAIVGIIDGEEEFIGTTDRCNRQVAYYDHVGLVVNALKLKGYAANKAAIDAWAASKGIRIING